MFYQWWAESAGLVPVSSDDWLCILLKAGLTEWIWVKSEMIKPATSHIKTMANDSNLHSADTDVKYSEEKVDRMSFPHGSFSGVYMHAGHGQATNFLIS